MKAIRRIVFALLIVIMVAGIFTTQSFAAVEASGTCGDNLTWVLDSSGTLTISGTGDMTNFADFNDNPWYDNNAKIFSVVIEPGVTSIGFNAFRSCSNLTKISIPESTTNIGPYAFFGCSSLTEITLPEGLSCIDLNTFALCTSLREINMPQSLHTIRDYAFYHCTNLTGITIPEGTQYIDDNAFTWCSSLTQITIPESVIRIGRLVFSECKSLKKIYVAEGNTAYSSDEYGVLFDKDKTTLIHCPSTFAGHYTIPKSVTSISECAFYSCTGLTGIDIPNSVNTIGDDAFYICRGLTEITIPEGVTNIGSRTFAGCVSLREISLPESITSIGSRAFGDCNSLTKIAIPSSVNTIGESAFSYCTSLKEITIPEGVTSISDQAFSGCSSLKKISLPESLNSIGYQAFGWCRSLTEIKIPSGVTGIGEAAFLMCSSLKEITIPEGVTSIAADTFGDCSSLTRVTIPKSVTSIGDSAFYRCPGLTSFLIPENVTSIGNRALGGCTGLTEIVIPGSVTNIGNEAFLNCTHLTKIKFMGNAPRMMGSTPGMQTSYTAGTFGGVEATAYYPIGYDGWTQEVLSSGYGGTITWVQSHEFHKEEIIPGTAATCTKPGLTDGKKCSVCGVVIVEQQTIPALGHSEVTIAAKAPTCAETGLTEGKKCSVCGIVLVKQQTIATIAHTEVTVAGKAPTCTQTGLTEGKKCSVCSKVILEQQAIKANGHSEIAVSGKSPTCSETGLTAGKKCSICGEILTKQETLPALGCSFINYTTHKNASCTADESKIAECIHECGNTDVITVTGSRDPDAHSFGNWITEDNKSHRICLLCGHTETNVSTDSGNVEIESPEQPGMDFEADPVKPSDDEYVLVEEAMDAVSGIVTEILKTFDITLKNADGVHVQPDGTVKVKLPLDWDKATGYKVYRVNDDGTLTDMGAYRQGSHVVFDTNHFSLYVIAEEANHNHVYQKKVTSPTCTDGGYTTYTCYCGDSYNADEVGAKGHSEVTVPGKAATCTRVGLTDGKNCSVCGEATLEQQIISAKGHSHEAKVTTSTCTTVGCTTYVCPCGDIYITDEMAPKGHSEVAVPGKAATCTNTGLTDGKKCSTCGTIIVAQSTIRALGHGYDNKVDGTCNRCGIHRETTETRTVMHMFRMYDPNSGEHFYTGSTEERANLVAEGWKYEGVGFTFSRTTGAPVYRLYDPVTGEHLYTMDDEERAMLEAQGWNFEGIAFNSAYNTEVPQYRLYNPNATRGAYHFTASIEEKDNLIAAGWEYQGIGFYSSWK